MAERSSPSRPLSSAPLTLPQSLEIERAVLGALQHAPDVGTALARLEPPDFASKGHRVQLDKPGDSRSEARHEGCRPLNRWIGPVDTRGAWV